MSHYYNITSLGFLPDDCVKTLPIALNYLQPLLDNLATSDGKKFRKLADQIENDTSNIPSLDYLNLRDTQFLYSILSMIVNKYV